MVNVVTRLMLVAVTFFVGASTVSAAELQYEVTPVRKLRARDKPDPVSLKFVLSGELTKPGSEVTLSITAKVTGEFHLFALDQDPKMLGLPTVITVDQAVGLEAIDKSFQPSRVPEVHTELEAVQKIYHGSITWKRRFKVTEAVKSSSGPAISGKVQYQICGNGMCLPRLTVPFVLGTFGANDRAATMPTTTTATDASVSSPTEPPVETVQPQEVKSDASLSLYLLYAFLGGLILNVMPCVLPVIAIKVLGFVKQAGESRSRILSLNLAYSVGIVSVFVTLATLAVVLGLGWGGLFRSTNFNLAMACLVFAMGLSLLGVFEIPIPGLVGSAAGSHQKEGLTGAFLTGVFATLLATPCSGPFLGTTLAWSVRQSPTVTYLIWTVMGLGMASPYLVFGLFPGMVKLLPKPGPWMIRFREFAGFVLMGTVIFIIYYLEPSYMVPALVMLLAIALGLWMIGNLYDGNSSGRKKMVVRGTALLLTLSIGTFGYRLTKLDVAEHSELPWQQFTEARLQSSLAERKTVLVDFTAKWCLTCKVNEKFALNTAETRELVDSHGVVTLYADYTRESPEIKKWLDKFDSISVPLTVIFPAGRASEPIVIRDTYSKAELLKNLQLAVKGSEVTL